MVDVMTRMKMLWAQMGMSQKVVFLSLSGAIAVTMLLFFTWLGKEDFVVMYSNLSANDSGRVIELLQKKNVDYRVSSGGGSISVPASKISEAKVAEWISMSANIEAIRGLRGDRHDPGHG